MGNGLHIEADELLGNGCNRTKAQQALDPGYHVAHSTLQRRGQPARPSLAIGEARLSVARMALPSTAPYPAPLREGLVDRRSAMADLGGEDDFTGGFIHDRQSSGLASWVEFNSQPLCLWVLHHSLENKREREAAQHRCLSLGEQEACVARMHRREWFPVGINDKHLRHAWFAPFRASCFQGKVGLDKVSERFVCR